MALCELRGPVELVIWLALQSALVAHPRAVRRRLPSGCLRPESNEKVSVGVGCSYLVLLSPFYRLQFHSKNEAHESKGRHQQHGAGRMGGAECCPSAQPRSDAVARGRGATASALAIVRRLFFNFTTA